MKRQRRGRCRGAGTDAWQHQGHPAHLPPRAAAPEERRRLHLPTADRSQPCCVWPLRQDHQCNGKKDPRSSQQQAPKSAETRSPAFLTPSDVQARSSAGSDPVTFAAATMAAPELPSRGLCVLHDPETKRNSRYLRCTELDIHSPPDCTHKLKLSTINFLQKKMCVSTLLHQPLRLSCLVPECWLFSAKFNVWTELVRQFTKKKKSKKTPHQKNLPQQTEYCI